VNAPAAQVLAEAVLAGRVAACDRRGRHATVRSTRVHRPRWIGRRQTVAACALLAFSAALPTALLGSP